MKVMAHAELRPTPVHYPESDGKPMAETDIHLDLMFDLIASPAYHFRDARDVYVSGNLLLYYEEGNPGASVAPDVFVLPGGKDGRGGRLRRARRQEGSPADLQALGGEEGAPRRHRADLALHPDRGLRPEEGGVRADRREGVLPIRSGGAVVTEPAPG